MSPAEAHARLDAITKPRSSADVARAMSLPIPARFVPGALNVALKALRFRAIADHKAMVRGKLVPMKPPYRERRAYVMERIDQYSEIAELIQRKGTVPEPKVRAKLLTAPLLALWLETLATAPDQARQFWPMVLHGEGGQAAHVFARDRLIENLAEKVENRPYHRLYGVVSGWNALVTETQPAQVSTGRLGALKVEKTSLAIR